MTCACGKHRTASGCAGARVLAARTPAQRRAHGREGGKTNAILDRDAILDRYRHLDRDAAILAAWADAKVMQKHKRYRVNQLRREAVCR